jgi:superfamily II DNA or RNA helicase
LTEQLQDQFRLLKRLYAAELKGFDEPRLEGRVLRELSRIYQRTDEPDIRRLFTLLFRRAAISHKCQQKIELAKRLGEFLMRQKGRGKRIFFFERIASAVEVEEEIEEGRCVDESFRLVADSLRSVDPHAWCKTIQSGLTSTDRQQILDEFRRFPAATLLCCRMLDEGLNVPEIDVAVLVSSSQTKRQRIQRIGRALRTTADNVRPLIISFYVSETTDAKTIQHDDELFKGVATIHRANAQNLIDQVQDLLASRDGK